MSAAKELDPKWSKAQRLHVAGSVAPHLRDQDDRTKGRRVARIDADGNVVGYTTLAEVQKALLRRQEIEFDVADGVRPKQKLCKHCGREFRVKPTGTVPKLCFACMNPNCADCGEVLPARGSSLSTRKTVRCSPCHFKRIAAPTRHCVDCDAELTSHARTLRCISCKILHDKPPQIPCSDCGQPLAKAANLAARRGTGGGRCTACRIKNKKTAACVKCGVEMDPKVLAPSTVAKRKGAPPTCKRCLLKPRASCSVCGKQLGAFAMSPSAIANRNGAPPKCHPCNAVSLKPRRGPVGPAAAKKAWATKRSKRSTLSVGPASESQEKTR